ncbi:uncharacterized protein BDZ99DRAFT_534948 [Mytilinidion resinicola]|uniref:Uncharacterized protein n=1 Tax=Mytilinidion resinicola TaxID=574789 RepID=A0A6A6YIN8_9PEZI|nr:uncharacterized protein BDZ99DRAFT_534948 [Mytilinidion resinicola]KAF2808660.1 hypothetical protein BDZ99DRAFT_534948 [Mytilinidion resinicola]
MSRQECLFQPYPERRNEPHPRREYLFHSYDGHQFSPVKRVETAAPLWEWPEKERIRKERMGRARRLAASVNGRTSQISESSNNDTTSGNTLISSSTRAKRKVVWEPQPEVSDLEPLGYKPWVPTVDPTMPQSRFQPPSSPPINSSVSEASNPFIEVAHGGSGNTKQLHVYIQPAEETIREAGITVHPSDIRTLQHLAALEAFWRSPYILDQLRYFCCNPEAFQLKIGQDSIAKTAQSVQKMILNELRGFWESEECAPTLHAFYTEMDNVLTHFLRVKAGGRPCILGQDGQLWEKDTQFSTGTEDKLVRAIIIHNTVKLPEPGKPSSTLRVNILSGLFDIRVRLEQEIKPIVKQFVSAKRDDINEQDCTNLTRRIETEVVAGLLKWAAEINPEPEDLSFGQEILNDASEFQAILKLLGKARYDLRKPPFHDCGPSCHFTKANDKLKQTNEHISLHRLVQHFKEFHIPMCVHFAATASDFPAERKKNHENLIRVLSQRVQYRVDQYRPSSNVGKELKKNFSRNLVWLLSAMDEIEAGHFEMRYNPYKPRELSAPKTVFLDPDQEFKEVFGMNSPPSPTQTSSNSSIRSLRQTWEVLDHVLRGRALPAASVKPKVKKVRFDHPATIEDLRKRLRYESGLPPRPATPYPRETPQSDEPPPHTGAAHDSLTLTDPTPSDPAPAESQHRPPQENSPEKTPPRRSPPKKRPPPLTRELMAKTMGPGKRATTPQRKPSPGHSPLGKPPLHFSPPNDQQQDSTSQDDQAYPPAYSYYQSVLSSPVDSPNTPFPINHEPLMEQDARPLEGLKVDEDGLVRDADGTIIGRVWLGDVKELARRIVGDKGEIRDENGGVIGYCQVTLSSRDPRYPDLRDHLVVRRKGNRKQDNRNSGASLSLPRNPQYPDLWEHPVIRAAVLRPEIDPLPANLYDLLPNDWPELPPDRSLWRPWQLLSKWLVGAPDDDVEQPGTPDQPDRPDAPWEPPRPQPLQIIIHPPPIDLLGPPPPGAWPKSPQPPSRPSPNPARSVSATTDEALLAAEIASQVAEEIVASIAAAAQQRPAPRPPFRQPSRSWLSWLPLQSLLLWAAGAGVLGALLWYLPFGRLVHYLLVLIGIGRPLYALWTRFPRSLLYRVVGYGGLVGLSCLTRWAVDGVNVFDLVIGGAVGWEVVGVLPMMGALWMPLYQLVSAVFEGVSAVGGWAVETATSVRWRAEGVVAPVLRTSRNLVFRGRVQSAWRRWWVKLLFFLVLAVGRWVEVLRCINKEHDEL